MLGSCIPTLMNSYLFHLRLGKKKNSPSRETLQGGHRLGWTTLRLGSNKMHARDLRSDLSTTFRLANLVRQIKGAEEN